MDPIVLVPISGLFLVAMFLGRNELVKRRLTCPSTGIVADVDIVQRTDHPDRPVRVKRCSLFPGHKKVGCDQACIKHTASTISG